MNQWNYCSLWNYRQTEALLRMDAFVFGSGPDLWITYYDRLYIPLPQWAASEASPVHLYCKRCSRVVHPMPHIWLTIEQLFKAGISIECYGDECTGRMTPHTRLDAWKWGMKGSKQ